jgi:hypothetical protein
VKVPKSPTLARHLEARQAVAEARHAVHARAEVAVSLLERAHQVRALDVEILDIERVIARISDTQKPERHRFRFGSVKVDLVISDQEQLRKLVAALRAWREALLGTDGEARIALAERLAAELMRGGSVSQTRTDQPPDPVPPLLNGHAPVSRWGA